MTKLTTETSFDVCLISIY